MTVLAQAGMGAGFVVVLVRSAGGDLRPQLRLMRRLVSVGRYIFIRTAALMAAFTLAGAIAARFGDASIAAHQIAFQLWIFLAFVADAIATSSVGDRRPRPRAGDTERLRGELADDLALRLRGTRVRGDRAGARGGAPACVHERLDGSSDARSGSFSP